MKNNHFEQQFIAANEFLLDIDDMSSKYQMPDMSDDAKAAYAKLVELGRAYYRKLSASEILETLEPTQIKDWKKDKELSHASISGSIDALRKTAKYVFGVDAAYFMDAIKE